MRLRISFGARVFMMTALLVILAVGAAVVATYFYGNKVAHDTARAALARASSVQTTLQQQRQEQLKLIARVFVGDQAIRAYITEAAASGSGASVLDLLEERQNDLGYDFAMALDPQGRVVARTDNPNAVGEDLSQRPLIQRAQQEFEATGFWKQDKRLFNAVAVPITVDQILQGFLVAGFAIDNEDADQVRKVSDADVAILADEAGSPQVVATTLGPAEVDELLAHLQQGNMVDPVMKRGESLEQVDLQLHGGRWIGLLRPLADSSGNRVGAVVSLASLDAELLPFQRIETLLAIVGGAAVLLALLSSFILGRRVFKPVRDLADAATAASEGNYSQRITIDRGDEVGRLAEAFNHLLSELREKQDMETYISELSRTLPSSNGDRHAAMEDAGTKPVALLGVDMRRYAQPKIGYDPESTIEQLAQDLRRVHAAVGARQGKIEGSFGQRLLISFAGDNRAFRALSAAAEIGSVLGVARTAFEEAEPPVLAITEGEAVTGSVVWGEGPERVVVGRPLLQLEGLLREGAPGDLVISQPLYGTLGEVFTKSGVELSPQRGMFGGAQTLYVMNGPTASKVTGVAGASLLPTSTDAPTRIAPTSGTAPAPAAREHATLAEISPGKVIGDRFEILSTLGAGGMGIVYKVRDRELDDLVALKMLKRDVWGDRELLERLKSELKLARKITHPNVLRTFDFGDVDGIPFITMEYVRGITLRYLLSETGALPYSAGLRLARQLCRGLAAAHEVGVLHRDIKPENLIVMPNGNAKLMDFGIARPIARMDEGQTQAGTVVGTPQYLAPEQLQGKPVDERADLWAVGVVLYELFTSQTPFKGENPMQVIVATLNEQPVPPRQYWPEMPEQLEEIILRCLARDPAKRYRTAAALLADLEALRA